MATAVSDSPTEKKVGRPRKATGAGKQVRVDSDLAFKVKFLASLRKLNVTDYLSAMIRTQVEQEFDQAALDVAAKGK